MRLGDKLRNENKIHLFLLGLIILVTIWSAINPFDAYMWRANFMVAITYIVVFTLLYKHFRFTTLTVVLAFVHIFIVLLAAKYTYEEFPPFNWLRDSLSLGRNYFDRVGHLFQGVAPVMIFREIFLKGNYMKKSKFFIFTLLMFVLGTSGLWELLEFVGSNVAGKTDAYFVSMQGDMWDAQWDMTMCLIGSIVSLLIFSKHQDRKMNID